MNDGQKTIAALGIITVAGVVIGALGSIKDIREERAKRKAIKVWETEMCNTIASSRRNLVAMLEDPNTTLQECVDAYRVEMAYINLIGSQNLLY